MPACNVVAVGISLAVPVQDVLFPVDRRKGWPAIDLYVSYEVNI